MDKVSEDCSNGRNVADVPLRLDLLHAIQQVLMRSTTVSETPHVQLVTAPATTSNTPASRQKTVQLMAHQAKFATPRR